MATPSKLHQETVLALIDEKFHQLNCEFSLQPLVDEEIYQTMKTQINNGR